MGSPFPSSDRLHDLFHYDPETGEFARRQWTAGVRDVSKAGFAEVTGYRRICVDGVKRYAHRMAWAMYYNSEPPKVIDHINGDPSDNRIVNLRAATHAENMRNAKGKGSSAKGVTFVKNRNKWAAQITVDLKHKFLGHFATEAEAQAAYAAAASKHFGSFARTA